MTRSLPPAALALALCLAGPALAHTGTGDVAGFSSGFVHPVLGPAHVIAMIAVGLWGVSSAPQRYGCCRSSSRWSWRSAAPSA